MYILTRTKLLVIFTGLLVAIVAGFVWWYLPHRPDTLLAKSVVVSLGQKSMEFRVMSDGPTSTNLKAIVDKHGNSSIVFAKDGQQLTIVSAGSAAYIQGPDGQWRSIPLETAAGGLLPGVSSGVNPAGLDEDGRQRLERVYKKQPFMEVSKVFADEAVDSHASYHYQILVNKQKLRYFLKSAQQDIPGLAIKDSQIPAIVDAPMLNKPFDVWIDTNTGLLRQVAYTSDESSTVRIVFDSFGKDNEIVVPQSAAPLVDAPRR